MNQELIDLGKYPLVFWLAAFIWLVLAAEAISRWHEPWAKPAGAVYGTMAAWYLGDLLYIGMDHFTALFPKRIVAEALWQVVLFLLTYRWLVWWLVPNFFRGLSRSTGPIRVDQRALPLFFLVCFTIWLGLFLVAAAMADWRILAMIWPPSSSEPIGMFAREGVGSGGDFLISTAGYFYILICSAFGVLFILNRGILRYCALAMILVSWPNIWFGPARNTMLALLLPGILTYWLFGRSWWQIKAAVTLGLFILVNFWFLGVQEFRGTGNMSLAERISFMMTPDNDVHHEGLDMLEEQCWMDSFIEVGLFHPNWGTSYTDEILNVVPRTFWANKPMIGLDYAVARGFGGNSASKMGVYATVATGVIGQGVASFGRFFGVIASALVMALWTGILSRLWLQRDRIPRLFLFIVGCGLTFSIGRDVTLLVLWPFWFGMIGVWFWERFFPHRPRPSAPSPTPVRRKSRSPRPKLYST